ncbi:hypothetical protein Poli38472_008023 [Pythium oligandrum]|uniref:Uncharacterized protein n=1 Tax=Pythium oligandrum TaxID=41045 RepID=A0A8K1CMH7_PYTOL|nr:hypothetical protein Poli38472_008023 [Pythium oligandrum]|eukprot:TMW65381.1 hypothetical protein Poli38472_008023 [Pythium oligandrum]
MMIAREAMETALQSYQAYRMSLYVPRVWLNRLFVALLVLNCSVTPLVLVFFKRRPMTCRLLYLLCDCVLDLMSSIGIPLILLPAYVKEFDPKVGGFDLSLSYDDVWYVSAVSELQLVFISSWMDLFSRVVFYIGFVGCMKSMKDLLRPKAGHARKRVRPASGAPTDIQTAVFSIPTSYDCAFVPTLKPLEPKPSGFPSLTTGTSPSNRRLKHLIHPGFVGWGLAIMILHLRAERQESLAQCLVQVRPWTAKKPACSLLSMDCHLDDGLGYAEDITPHWDHVDEATVTRIVIRHCSQLYIPPKITTLTNVYTIKIYNSTVVDWGNEAALTNRHHPWLNVLLVLRSNFTDGQLPRGLLSADFPLILKGIEFQISNLRTLPDDLDTKWHSRSYLVFENCQFDQFPLVLQRLAPNVISFAFNRIGIVPFGVFQVNGITHLNLADNPISPLSKPSRSTFASISSIISLNLVRTNVSYLPRWIDPILNRAAITPVVLLRDSPFCVHRNEIADSRRSHFLELDFVPLDQLSDTMRLTAPQLHMLDKKVSYTSSEIYYYLYERDDALNRLQVAT